MEIVSCSRMIDRLREREVSVPLLAGGSALIAFVTVIWLSKQVVGNLVQPAQTAYAIAMGLLGSSLFLLYNLIGVIPEQRFKPVEVGENLARLFVGPVAGWLSYFMWITAHPGAVPDKGSMDTTQIWLPFVAGFSSDLMVGIITQGVRAIKFTLGLDKMESKILDNSHTQA